jgi:solute carrier family 25 carnitine/acylcarnitine transporter 20/29
MENNNIILNLLPGFCQGLTRVTISYPFDVVKTNMQKHVDVNLYSTIKNLIKQDPFRFYRGATFSYVSVSFERAIQFYCLEKMNKIYKNTYMNGFLFSLFASIYNVPVQFITTNIALNNTKTKLYLKYIIENKINLYKGSQLEILRNTINSTIFMGTYYYLRNTFGENTGLSPFYGAFSGLACWTVTLPIDTLRTDYQSSTQNIKALITNRFKNGGLFAFYRGFTPIILRTIPSASAGMYIYENVRNYISNELKNKQE